MTSPATSEEVRKIKAKPQVFCGGFDSDPVSLNGHVKRLHIFSCPELKNGQQMNVIVKILELDRYFNRDGKTCFSDLTQSEYSTGESIRKGSITRQGRGCIRGWLIQCAWMCIRIDPAMLHAINRIWSNTRSKKKAIVAIARKLVVRLWTCLHTSTEYCIGVIE